jgi:hypothetical protein
VNPMPVVSQCRVAEQQDRIGANDTTPIRLGGRHESTPWHLAAHALQIDWTLKRRFRGKSQAAHGLMHGGAAGGTPIMHSRSRRLGEKLLEWSFMSSADKLSAIWPR